MYSSKATNLNSTNLQPPLPKAYSPKAIYPEITSPQAPLSRTCSSQSYHQPVSQMYLLLLNDHSPGTQTFVFAVHQTLSACNLAASWGLSSRTDTQVFSTVTTAFTPSSRSRSNPHNDTLSTPRHSFHTTILFPHHDTLSTQRYSFHTTTLSPHNDTLSTQRYSFYSTHSFYSTPFFLPCDISALSWLSKPEACPGRLLEVLQQRGTTESESGFYGPKETATVIPTRN
jgi:hypothetical protein